MKRCVFFTLMCMISGFGVRAATFFQTLDKAGFYSVMASGKLTGVDSELSVLAALPAKEKDAYEGALLMRKAGLLSHGREKLATFRAGAVKLERSIALDSGNAEYHFLRLMIQEHAPRVVHYDKDLGLDSRDIIRTFPSLPPVVRRAIRNYCPHSKILHESELNG